MRRAWCRRLAARASTRERPETARRSTTLRSSTRSIRRSASSRFKFVHSGTAPVDPSLPARDALRTSAIRATPDARSSRDARGDLSRPCSRPGRRSRRRPTRLPVAGQMDTHHHRLRRPAGIRSRSGTSSSSAAATAELQLRLAQLRRAGEGRHRQPIPGLVTLAQYNDPAHAGPASSRSRAKIGKGLYSLMDRLPPTDVLLGSIVSLGADQQPAARHHPGDAAPQAQGLLSRAT